MCLAIPGRVVEIGRHHDLLVGRVDFGGIARRICLEHVPEVAEGDWVLVHVGFALARIDEEEARRVLAMLDEGELAELDVPAADAEAIPAAAPATEAEA